MLSRIVLAVVLVAALPLPQGAAKPRPQVFYSRELKREIATYLPDQRIVRFSSSAPPTLMICMQDRCRTQAEWIALK